jgi:hypothetical protein
MEHHSGWKRSAPVLIAVCAAALRLAPLLHSDLYFIYRPDDSYEYLQLANGFWHGCGFARFIHGACQAPEILRTPGYPLFLASLPSIKWALTEQGLLGGIVCLLVFATVESYWTFAAAIVAELFVAFDMTSVVMSTEVMSETLFQVAMVCALLPVLLAVSRGTKPIFTAVVVGCVAGFAVLVRPIGIILPLLLPIPFILAPSLSLRQRVLAASLSFVIPLLIIGGWAARNYRVAGYRGISTVSAINMYYYRGADVVARAQGARLDTIRAEFGPRLGVSYEHIYEANVQSAALARRMYEVGFQIVEQHPVQTFAMTAQGLLYLMLAPIRSPLAEALGTKGATAGDGLNAGAPSVSRLRNTIKTTLQSPLLSFLVLFEILFTAALWLGIAIGLIRCLQGGSHYRIWVLYLAAAGVLLLALAAGGEADARFRAPVAPFLAIAAALGYFPLTRTAEEDSIRRTTVRIVEADTVAAQIA